MIFQTLFYFIVFRSIGRPSLCAGDVRLPGVVRLEPVPVLSKNILDASLSFSLLSLTLVLYVVSIPIINLF